MKIIHSGATQIIGPFKQILEREDHLLVDGTSIRKSLLGAYSFVDDSVMFANAEQEAEHAADVLALQKEEKFLLEVESIKKGYTQAEIDSWPEQLQEARNWAADAAVQTPMLDAIVGQTGEPKAALVTNILEKAELYAAAFGAALGRKRA